MRHLLCGTVLGGLIVVQGGLASAQQIVPNGLGTQVTVNGQQFDITGGTRAGANLFHSFAKFGLSQAQIAHFLSNPAIRNILARVTGGEVSVINGLIKVTGGNSNLYLMNPAGIVFGQGASLNVPAAFHATTANAIKIGNGYFGMNTTAAELALLTAEPNGYAFSSLNQNLNPGTPAGVILNQADLSVNPGQTIVLAGNQVINTGTIQSPNGTVVITATADGKFVNVSQSGSILSLDLPVAVNQDIALQNLRPVLPSDIPQLLTGTAYVSGTVSTASTVKNPDSLINITGERVILDKANLDNLGTDGLIQIRVAPGITSEGYVFLDRVRNYEQLVNALAPGSTAYLINKTDSGVEKVNQVVAKNGAVQRIDIVGDGNTGQIWFGRDFITVDTLPQYETQIAQWGQGLTGSREIYLYACNLAASVAGKELVGEIGNLTNSTVLASTDITGSGQYGGNWQFEYSTGNVAGQLVFDAQAVQSADVKLQTFTVLNNSDTGSGSLRQAISDANAASGADSIAFAPATNGTPIVLTTGELTVTDSAGLTITGNGATNTIIDGNKTSRVFNVKAGDITFDGVTIRNGNTLGNGGGIFADSGVNVTLTNSTVSGNTSGSNGGGVRANGDVTLNNSTVSGNTAISDGGGVYAKGNITLTNSTVSGNTSSSFSGGGILANGNVTLTNSTVSGNKAFNQGGGIRSSGFVILNNSTVSNNQATGDFSDGGGIYASGNVTLTNSTVSGNTSSGFSGGGIYAFGTVTLTNSTVSGNRASLVGGGIFAYFGRVTLNNSTVSGNTAIFDGGGIFAKGNVTLTNSTVSGNTSGSNGGGIFASGNGNVTLTNSTVSGNKAFNQGGGIFADSGVNVTLNNSTVSGNTSGRSGGGIFANGNGTIRNSTIAFNTSDIGGGIFNNSGTIDIGNSIVAKNTAATSPDIGSSPIIGYTNAGNNLIGINTGFEATFPASPLVGTASSPVDPLLAPLADNGGATQTHALLPGSPAINAGNNALIPSGVTTDQRGEGFARIVGGTVDIGAFEVQSISPIPNPPDFSNLIVTNGNDSGAGSLRFAILTANDLAGADTITFSSNFIISLTSGELTVTDPAGLTITGNGATNTIIDGNNISRVFNITAGDITFNGVTIRNGNTPGDGGGILANGNVTLTNSTVSSNTAGTRGGGIYADGNATLTNSTVSGNTSGSVGGGIFADNATLTNSTVSGNTSGSNGGGILANGTVTLNNSTVSNNKATDGGGIFAYFGTVTLTNSTVSNNKATDGYGGGIFAYLGTVTLTNSTVSNNQATDGGGIFAYLGTVTLTNSTVSNNQATGQFSVGGGIFADNATLTDSTVSNNQATGGFSSGGGIYAVGNATLTNSTVSGNTSGSIGGGIFADNVTLTNSTVAGNTAGSQGGGIFARFNATLTNSTVSNNQATGQFSGGGGIFANGGGTIRNSTIAFNTAKNGGGIFSAGGTSDIGNSIVAKNTAPNSPDIGGSSYTNAGNNLIGINTGFEATFPASSLVGTASSPVDPLLAPLANNGGATQTHALLPGSPAINAGNNALIPSGVTTDQRGAGFARIVGGTVDIGAFEVQSISPIPNPPDFSNLIVTNGNDSGAGSLRFAILTANDLAGADTITFSSNFIISLTSGELTVTDPAGLTITGNGATNTIIDGNNISRVFNITAGDITFNGVTIRNGNTPGNGGGIFADSGVNVTLNNSTVSGNTASSEGGGIFTRGNLTLNNSTVSGNRTITSYGGGIRADFGAGIITLNNSTVSGNRAGSDAGGIDSSGAGVILNNSTVSGNTGTRGGGIWSSGFVILTNSTVSGNTGTDGGGIWSSGTTTIRNSTIAFNTGNRGGGIFSAGGTVNIGNSIVAKNTAPNSPDIGGSSYTNAGNNLIGINTGFEATFPTSSLVGTASSPVDPLLAPLANNGGLTQTHALLPGSPAINAGNNALIPSGVTTDQRGEGFARIVGGTVDIGAFELQRVVESRNENVVNEILFGQEFVTPNFDFGLDAIEDVALTDFVARFDIAEALGTGDFEAILALDTLFTGEFDRFLGVNPINDLNSVEAIGNMLSRLAQETGKKPAIVYLMVDERQLTIAAIPPGSRAGVAQSGLVASTAPLVQREAQVQPVVRGVPEAKRSALMPVVERFLTALKDPRQRTSTAYLKDAQQLYRWFIAPIEQELQAQGIDTLLFSMDNGLRLLPVAALHDGQQFLVEKYSTALIPSVNLIDTRYRNLRDGRVLAMGADTFANQAPLPAVPVELKVITEEWPGQSFLNQEFTVQRLTQERLQGGYPIIHLATHADFAPGRITNSYIEFGNNQRLNLPQVRELPLREPNVVELLTLSACRTSVGDVSAELGFAGLAVQSGVKSALASLWYVSDEGTLALMTEFYKNLRQAPIKAEALRQAQIAMLQGKVTIKGGELRGVRGGIPVPSAIAQRGDQVLNHPYYWAAFTLIGSPW